MGGNQVCGSSNVEPFYLRQIPLHSGRMVLLCPGNHHVDNSEWNPNSAQIQGYFHQASEPVRHIQTE